jgi:CubicO group peptidase (beta-lactamase class C family)
MKPCEMIVSLLFIIVYAQQAAVAAEDSLVYRIGYSEQISTDLKTFDRNAEFFLTDLLLSADGTAINPDDFAASFQIAWNQVALLIYVDVSDDEVVVNRQDDQLWANDSIEVFLSPSVGGGGYYQLVLAVDSEGTLRSYFYDFREKKDVPLRHFSLCARTASGYRIMAKLPWSNLDITPALGMEIGMQIFANDSDGGRQTLQWQWYPHYQNHSSSWMHRLQLHQNTTDKHLTNCRASIGQEDLRMDIYAGPQTQWSEFDIVDGTGKKAAIGYLHNTREGLKKASVLIPIRESRPLRFQFVYKENVIGKAVVLGTNPILKERIRSLQNMTLVPQSRWGYIFETGSIPQVKWSDPQTMSEITGNQTPQVKWFDAALKETDSFDKPGRYLVYAGADMPDGKILRRSATFYAIPKGSHPWKDDIRFVLYNRSRPWWHPWQGGPYARMEYLPGLGFEQSAWENNQTMLSAWAGKAFFEFLESDPYGPVLLSYLSEYGADSNLPTAAQTPEIINDEIQLSLKRFILGTNTIQKSLLPPQTISPQALTLRTGTPQEAGFAEDAPRRIRDLCCRWVEDSGEPFAVLIARNGVVFFHEAFGRRADGSAVTVDTPMFMASITKCMSGLLLAQFVDQGLLDIDDPVGRFLPDFPTEGEKAITFRHCFTHTTGLTGHYEFGGMHNPWLENAIALGLSELPVGKVHEYNGMGYDLAGKAMEMAAGKSAFRIMHENLYQPLGMTHTVLDDMASCSTSTPMDVARLGQLILNGGAYGDKRFFSPETLSRLLPCELNPYFPAIQKNWGIGMTWMNTEDPDAQTTGRPHLFSSRVVGHGAASSAVFRVDLENRLIIVQTRNQAGRDYDKYLPEFLKVIDRAMKR